MNKVILMGRLTRDPDVRYSQGENASAFARYTLAVERRFKRDGDQTADFIGCVAFGKLGEFAEKYFHQGMRISVSGHIQTGSYTNKDGVRVYTTEVIVEEQEFAESRAESEANRSGQQSKLEETVDENGFMNIPEGLEEYINDYEMKVFEIAWLTEEEISRFHSDFKVVANFFVQKRKNKDYIPDDPTEIRHIDEVLKLLRVMTGDERYQAIFQKERGVHSMCDVAERLEKMGMEKGIEKGIEKGMEQGVKQGRKLGRNEGIHEEKIRVYKKLLEKGFSKQEAQEITELPQFLEN